MSYREYAFKVRETIRKHHNWMSEALPMIASENVTSALVREVTASDFGHRYAEGKPGKRLYQGCRYIDEVENIAVELAKKLFNAPYVNVLPTSGVVSNLAVYSAFSKPGDTLIALRVAHGGHISHAELSAAGVRGLKVTTFPFNHERMNIDVDQSIKKIRETRPRIILFGASVFLFPHPVRELKDVADEVGATVVYDAAHVLGLIAGREFQQPLKEGVDVISSSRHKTFPGPQGGIILAKEEHGKRLDRAVFPGLVSNHHLHHLAGLAVALAEMLDYGKSYARQIVKNSRALAEALHNRGFNVLCESQGFTKSHQVLVDVSEYGGGAFVAETLEKANIIINKNLLPWDDIARAANPSGIRLGTQELTRIGFKEGDMEEVAEFFKRLVIDMEEVEKVKNDVVEMRKNFTEVSYAFDSGKPYKYYEFL
jgi:glycine hydroxymethyltransferase